MSASDRAAIAAAASSVDGINVTPYYRQDLKPGEGCVQLVSGTVNSRIDRMATWRVLVVIPQDIKAAEPWIDSHINELLDAIWPELVITTWAPEQLTSTVGGASVHGLFIEGNRAQ